jgi:hypothetical protein
MATDHQRRCITAAQLHLNKITAHPGMCIRIKCLPTCLIASVACNQVNNRANIVHSSAAAVSHVTSFTTDNMKTGTAGSS